MDIDGEMGKENTLPSDMNGLLTVQLHDFSKEFTQMNHLFTQLNQRLDKLEGMIDMTHGISAGRAASEITVSIHDSADGDVITARGHGFLAEVEGDLYLFTAAHVVACRPCNKRPSVCQVRFFSTKVSVSP